MAKDIKVRFKGEDKGAISTTKKVKGELGDLDKTVNKSSASMLKAGAAIGVVVVALRTISRVMNDLQEAYYKQEAAVTKLEAALKATNNALGMSSTELQGFASELSRVTAIADEDIIATEALMVTFTKIGRDVFPTAIKAAADMSVMFGQDLQQSAIQLGTALNDPIAGVGRLRRIGIAFTEEQKSMIASFMEVNDLAGAQGVILNELSAEFGGVAEAMGQTAQAVGEKLKNAFIDLKEVMGKVISEGAVPFKTRLTEIIDAIRNSIQTMQLLKTLPGEVELFFTAYDKGFLNVGEEWSTLQNYIDQFIITQSYLENQLETAGRKERKNLNEIIKVIAEYLGYLFQIQEEWEPIKKDLDEQADLISRLAKGYSDYEIALEKTLTADEKKRREYQTIVDQLDLYREALEEAGEWNTEYGQGVQALINTMIDLRDAVGEVTDAWSDLGGEIDKWPAGGILMGGMGQPLFPALPQAGTPPIGGAAGGGAQMLLRPTPEPPTKSMDAIAIFSRALEATIGGLMNFLNLFQSFQAVIQPLQLIFQGMMQVLQPLVDQILQPLIGIFIIIGRVLGSILAPVFEALAMIVDKLAQAFVWFYNKVIRPVGNFIISIFNIVANAMIAFANLFRRKSREIAYRPLTQGHLGEISLGDVYGAGETGMGGTTADLGSTTTIQRQPDIYIYVNFNDAVIGPMGWEQAGADIADALERHAGIGGIIHIEEAIAPVGG